MMFLLVSKFKMIGMLLNVVHSQIKKANKQKTESKGFHNHATLITMVPGKFHVLDTTQSSEMSGIFLPIHYVHVH